MEHRKTDPNLAITVSVFVSFLTTGLVAGSLLGWSLAPKTAGARFASGACENDRCNDTFCVNAGDSETSCRATAPGKCITLPCGEAGSIPVLVTFPTPESRDQLVGLGRPAMHALLDRVESADRYSKRQLALEALVRMVEQWDEPESRIVLEDAERARLRAATLLYLDGPPPEHLEPEEHTFVMLKAIDLALELGDAGLRETVRAFASGPDEVRRRVGGDAEYPYRLVVQHARARLKATEQP